MHPAAAVLHRGSPALGPAARPRSASPGLVHG
jgi:hypothetical protein